MSNWRPENYRAEEIIQNIKNKKFVVPQYQRGQIWKTTQEKSFIDSIKKGYPFGTLLLYEDQNDVYHIIDGLQRCTTIYKYLNNPASFFNEEDDISDDVINDILVLLNLTGHQKRIVHNIKQIITTWVKNSHHSLLDVERMQYAKCAKKIVDEFPTGEKHKDEIADLLEPMFQRFIDECSSFNHAQIPVIVYQGDRSHLPEVFKRINSQGTNLTKYQILAATWSNHSLKITEPKLEPIIEYIQFFFASLIKTDFMVEGYDEAELLKKKEVTLYQAIFGFGKLLKVKYPYLFGKSDKAKDVESCGFTLINSCLGNKNSKLEILPEFIKSFKTDEDLNIFFIKILEVCDLVNRIFAPYNEFKLNKRSSVSVLHSELQICSIIANLFINKFGRIIETEKEHLISLNLSQTNSDWRARKKLFQNNAFYNYLSDILNQRWSGSGDSKLDDVIYTPDYYISEKTRNDLEYDLDHWFSMHNSSRNESKNVATPKDQEKLLLSIIYISKFKASEHLDDSKYDIEHLATKGALKKHLNQFPDDKLPISSFANIALLPEANNRRKKDKTIYYDDKYLNELSVYPLDEIERDFTFTKKEDLEWLNNEYNNFDDLKSDYLDFLQQRFEIQKEMILNSLF